MYTPGENPTFRPVPCRPEPVDHTPDAPRPVPLDRSHSHPFARNRVLSADADFWPPPEYPAASPRRPLPVDRSAEPARLSGATQLISPCPCGPSPRHVAKACPSPATPSRHRPAPSHLTGRSGSVATSNRNDALHAGTNLMTAQNRPSFCRHRYVVPGHAHSFSPVRLFATTKSDDSQRHPVIRSTCDGRIRR
jgi:hypothetical protein